MSKDTKNNSNRRTLLKGLAITLPAAWARPVVESVVLPAHAQTSTTETPQGCSAPAGCYNMPLADPAESFQWPGGAGPEQVEIRGGSTCEGDNLGQQILVVAANQAEAESAFLNSYNVDQLLVSPADSLTAGCYFFQRGTPILNP